MTVHSGLRPGSHSGLGHQWPTPRRCSSGRWRPRTSPNPERLEDRDLKMYGSRLQSDFPGNLEQNDARHSWTELQEMHKWVPKRDLETRGRDVVFPWDGLPEASSVTARRVRTRPDECQASELGKRKGESSFVNLLERR